MVAKEFNSLLDLNKILYHFDIFQSNLKESFEVFYLLNEIVKGKIYRHKIDNSYYTIHHEMLYNILGRKKTIERTHLFYDIFTIESNYSFNNNIEERNRTYGYKLNFEIEFALYNSYFVNDKEVVYTRNKLKEISFYSVDKTNLEVYSSKQKLKEGLNVSMSKIEQIKHKYLEIIKGFCYRDFSKDTNILKFDIDHEARFNTEAFNERINSLKKDFGINPTIGYMSNYLHFMSNPNFNKLIGKVCYARKKGGRLFQVPTYPHTGTAQQLSKDERAYLFKGQYEYDISNSVVTILYNEFQRVNKETKFSSIEKYIKDKNFYRYELMKLGFTYEQAKAYFIALFFGADLVENIEKVNHYSKIKNELGIENLERALSNIHIQELVTEFIHLSDELSRYYKSISTYDKEKREWKIINMRKSTLSLNIWNDAKVLSFIYNGVESTIMDIVFRKCYDNLSLLIFDGFILDRELTREEFKDLATEIREKIGYSVTWESKLL